MNSGWSIRFLRVLGWSVQGLVCSSLFALAGCEKSSSPPREQAADVVIIGAGILGLSAALEAAQAGRSALVIDMLSVFGGHAIVSTGGLSIHLCNANVESRILLIWLFPIS